MLVRGQQDDWMKNIESIKSNLISLSDISIGIVFPCSLYKKRVFLGAEFNYLN